MEETIIVHDIADALILHHTDWYFLGVRPKCAPFAFDDVNLTPVNQITPSL
jgi:hypothetical protein